MVTQVANVIPQDIDVKFNDYKIVYNNKLYFTATNQLWQSDGTTAGTSVLVPFNYFDPKYYKIFNGKLYFTAYNNAGGREVWTTDGTSVGTILLKDIYPGSNPSIDPQFDPHFTVFNDKLYFVANDGFTGFELWSTDGTTSGTSLFKDLRTTDSEVSVYDNGAFKITSTYSKVPFKVANNKMYFLANSDFTNQYGASFRLFETDGTSAGTTYVEPQIPAGSGITTNFLDAVNSMTVINNELFASGSTLVVAAGGSGTTSSAGIFKITGTTAVTQVGNTVLYAGDSGSGDNTEQMSMKLFNGEYYFIAPGATAGSNLELWKMNPITFQFTQVSQPAAESYILFNTNNGFSKLLLSQEWNEKLYFSKADSVNGALFSTDGTLAGTTIANKHIAYSQAATSPLTIVKKAPTELNAFTTGLYFSASYTAGIQPSVYRFYYANLSTSDYGANKFTVYPNPTSDVINFNGNQRIKFISICDVVGNLIKYKNIDASNAIIDISSFNSGIYFCKIYLQDGASITQKIIKN